jgi:hypothetical protein
VKKWSIAEYLAKSICYAVNMKVVADIIKTNYNAIDSSEMQKKVTTFVTLLCLYNKFLAYCFCY